MRFVLASNNPGKLREMREILSPMGIEVVTQNEAGCTISAQENGTTFEENAFSKAILATTVLGLPAIADDSGLCVDALGGAPGVFSARYGGPEAKSDTDRVALLLKNMEGESERSARFVSCICCTFPNGDRIDVRGECEGSITRRPIGEGGFGYDPVFLPEGCGRTMAELTAEEKNALSHRGKALRELKQALEEYYGTDK